jgi:hypothetical protein
MDTQHAYSQLTTQHPQTAASLAHMIGQGFSIDNVLRTLRKREPGAARLLQPAADHLAAQHAQTQTADERRNH